MPQENDLHFMKVVYQNSTSNILNMKYLDNFSLNVEDFFFVCFVLSSSFPFSQACVWTKSGCFLKACGLEVPLVRHSDGERSFAEEERFCRQKEMDWNIFQDFISLSRESSGDFTDGPGSLHPPLTHQGL